MVQEHINFSERQNLLEHIKMFRIAFSKLRKITIFQEEKNTKKKLTNFPGKLFYSPGDHTPKNRYVVKLPRRMLSNRVKGFVYEHYFLCTDI